jgi:hypothetical protein
LVAAVLGFQVYRHGRNTDSALALAILSARLWWWSLENMLQYMLLFELADSRFIDQLFLLSTMGSRNGLRLRDWCSIVSAT